MCVGSHFGVAESRVEEVALSAAKYVGRVGGLAVALGVGSAVVLGGQAWEPRWPRHRPVPATHHRNQVSLPTAGPGANVQPAAAAEQDLVSV